MAQAKACGYTLRFSPVRISGWPNDLANRYAQGAPRNSAGTREKPGWVLAALAAVGNLD
jgi:hypothetical protein